MRKSRTNPESHSMTPKSFNCCDMPIKMANQINVSHAPFCSKASSQDKTPLMSIKHKPVMAATTAAIPSGAPKIHKNTVVPKDKHMRFSISVNGPMACNFFAASMGAFGVAFNKGGSTINTINGVTIMHINAGTNAATAHSLNGLTNGMPIPMAICMHKKFCAAPDIKNADVAPVPCNCCPIKNSCVLGSKDLMTGMNTPAALAVVDGIAGDNNASAN
mmetsp:Transcript_2643/g.8445  ORF Transcript_2643/g.8445 Transcript_2643/m.8445 type:complete len:218 (-) Transcript_2643:1097-1750(-)